MLSQFGVSHGPCIADKCMMLNVKFLLTIFKAGAETFSFTSHISNLKLAVHLAHSLTLSLSHTHTHTHRKREREVLEVRLQEVTSNSCHIKYLYRLINAATTMKQKLA
jgi:diphthamide synthase (EF-2-diphthine--ammonia ligase)